MAKGFTIQGLAKLRARPLGESLNCFHQVRRDFRPRTHAGDERQRQGHPQRQQRGQAGPGLAIQPQMEQSAQLAQHGRHISWLQLQASLLVVPGPVGRLGAVAVAQNQLAQRRGGSQSWGQRVNIVPGQLQLLQVYVGRGWAVAREAASACRQ